VPTPSSDGRGAADGQTRNVSLDTVERKKNVLVLKSEPLKEGKSWRVTTYRGSEILPSIGYPKSRKPEIREV
jgi:hypothetical protein